MLKPLALTNIVYYRLVAKVGLYVKAIANPSICFTDEHRLILWQNAF